MLGPFRGISHRSRELIFLVKIRRIGQSHNIIFLWKKKKDFPCKDPMTSSSSFKLEIKSLERSSVPIKPSIQTRLFQWKVVPFTASYLAPRNLLPDDSKWHVHKRKLKSRSRPGFIYALSNAFFSSFSKHLCPYTTTKAAWDCRHKVWLGPSS